MNGRLEIIVESVPDASPDRPNIRIKANSHFESLNLELCAAILNTACDALGLSGIRRNLVLMSLGSEEYNPIESEMVCVNVPTKGGSS